MDCIDVLLVGGLRSSEEVSVEGRKEVERP